eukprot:TRINITY_DN277_c0_g2_i2.p2 TRINITY_DN277_c0_g2~~TRINITY_DN277_c0_g2_i2.p2  ORF type:complete len:280 (+),score=68.10 TRINITY_DN277_c0_g2_i2:45-884(+)
MNQRREAEANGDGNSVAEATKSERSRPMSKDPPIMRESGPYGRVYMNLPTGRYQLSAEEMRAASHCRMVMVENPLFGGVLGFGLGKVLESKIGVGKRVILSSTLTGIGLGLYLATKICERVISQLPDTELTRLLRQKYPAQMQSKPIDPTASASTNSSSESSFSQEFTTNTNINASTNTAPSSTVQNPMTRQAEDFESEEVGDAWSLTGISEDDGDDDDQYDGGRSSKAQSNASGQKGPRTVIFRNHLGQTKEVVLPEDYDSNESDGKGYSSASSYSRR